MPAASYAAATNLHPFNVHMTYGAAPQVLFQYGTLTVKAECVANGTDPGAGVTKDYVNEFGVSSTNCATVINSSGTSGPLDVATTPSAASVAYISAPHNGAVTLLEGNGNGYGMGLVDAQGKVIEFPDGVIGSINKFGSSCSIAGLAVTL